MPTYVYRVVREQDDDSDDDVFEVEQGIRDPPLTQHPETGKAVERLLCAPFVAGTWSPLKSKRILSDGNLEKRGFTRYVRNRDGQYEKRAGTGPDLMSGSGK